MPQQQQPLQLRRLLLLVAAAATTAAIALPPTAATTNRISNRLSPPNKTPAPSIEATTPEARLDCDLNYCANGTSWCFYWAGVTAYDPSLGPVPGETRVAMGLCHTATDTTAAAAAEPEPTTL